MRITPQFSYNLYCEIKSPENRVKFKKAVNHMHRRSEVTGEKWKTSLKGLNDIDQPKLRSDAKSVLELMARSVEVRTEPTSQSGINWNHLMQFWYYLLILLGLHNKTNQHEVIYSVWWGPVPAAVRHQATSEYQIKSVVIWCHSQKPRKWDVKVAGSEFNETIRLAALDWTQHQV